MRQVLEADEQLKAHLLLTPPGDNFAEWLTDFVKGRFDIGAKVLTSEVGNYDQVGRCVESLRELDKSLQAWINRSSLPSWVDKDEVLAEIKLRVLQRTAHWSAEAWRHAREAEERKHPAGGTPVAETRTIEAETEAPPQRNSKNESDAPHTPVARTGGRADGESQVSPSNLANWLEQALSERMWTPKDLEKKKGPSDKTTRRILAGGTGVEKSTREKLARALKVPLLDVPER